MKNLILFARKRGGKSMAEDVYKRQIKSRSEKNADKAILPKLNDEFEEKAAKLKDLSLIHIFNQINNK